MSNAPSEPGLFIFKGYRQSHPGSVQMMCEPVKVIEVNYGREKELVVLMLGRPTRYQLSRFSGEWWKMELEMQP